MVYSDILFFFCENFDSFMIFPQNIKNCFVDKYFSIFCEKILFRKQKVRLKSF